LEFFATDDVWGDNELEGYAASLTVVFHYNGIYTTLAVKTPLSIKLPAFDMDAEETYSEDPLECFSFAIAGASYADEIITKQV
jgi:hypothetical protein